MYIHNVQVLSDSRLIQYVFRYVYNITEQSGPGSQSQLNLRSPFSVRVKQLKLHLVAMAAVEMYM